MANETPYFTQLQCNTIHIKTFQLHKRKNWLSTQMIYLHIITLALSPIQARSQTP